MVKLKLFLGQTICKLRKKENEVKMFLVILKIVKAYVRNQSMTAILQVIETLLELIIQ